MPPSCEHMYDVMRIVEHFRTYVVSEANKFILRKFGIDMCQWFDQRVLATNSKYQDAFANMAEIAKKKEMAGEEGEKPVKCIYGLSPDYDDPVVGPWSFALARHFEYEQWCHEDKCWSEQIVLFPLPGKVLGMYFGAVTWQSFFTKWLEMSKASSYGYWDNTDPDSECTAEEWEQRAKDWDEVFPHNHSYSETPALMGLTIDVLPPLYNFLPISINPDELAENLPSLQQRAKGVASNIVFNRNIMKTGEGVSADNAVRLIRAAEDGAKDLIGEIEPLLPDVLASPTFAEMKARWKRENEEHDAVLP